MTIAHKVLSESVERFDFASVSSTEVPATPTSCVELLKEVAEGAVASLLDDDDSFNSQPSNPLLDTPPNSHTAAFLAGWLSGSQSAPVLENPSLNFASLFDPSIYMQRGDSPLGQTSVMLRNIPNKYTRSGLLTALAEHGFDASKHCNNLYLPMDAGSGCNLGYAFLNFHSHEEAMDFMKRFDGCRLPSAGSRKVCSVVWANRQGIFQHSNPPSRADEPDMEIPQSSLPEDLFAGSTNCCKVFIGGLSAQTTEPELVAYFSVFGEVKECCIVTNRQTGTSRGFGFCEFAGPDGVQRVHLAQLRKPHCINGRVVSVRLYNFQHNNPLSMYSPAGPWPGLVSSYF